MKLLIGLDIGTTALKAAVFDTAGKLLAVSTQEYDLITPQVNYVEEKGEVYWNAFKHAVADLKEKHPMSEEDEAALAISAQGETIFFSDLFHLYLRRKSSRPVRKLPMPLHPLRSLDVFLSDPQPHV